MENLFEDLTDILVQVTKAFSSATGVTGLVLGGSRAMGTHNPSSDVDLAIYYNGDEDFDVQRIGGLATILDDEHRTGLFTDLGEWGPWINGGGWFECQGYLFDIIFRDVNRVSQVIDDCLRGAVSAHYHAGHPHAFINAIYFGELATGQILIDPENRLTALQEKTAIYPQSMQQAIIKYFMFEANYSLMFAADNLAKEDLSYVAGCIYRAIACLNQVLFALNKEYCLNEKKAVLKIDGFELKPSNYGKKIEHAVTLINPDTDKTGMAIEMLQDMLAETETISQSQ